MTLNRPLGLSLVAAALLTVYGCGKEEPKTVAPAAAPAMPEVTVKVGHVGPTTGPQAHLGKDVRSGRRRRPGGPETGHHRRAEAGRRQGRRRGRPPELRHVDSGLEDLQ